jgi:hypothetical protein
MTTEQIKNNIEGLRKLGATEGLEVAKKYIDDILLPALEELKEYKESSLRPAIKYLNNDIDTQIEYIKSEVQEMINEKGKNKKEYGYGGSRHPNVLRNTTFNNGI